MTFDNFKRRMSIKGNSRYERAFNQKQRSFNEWFKNTLTRHLVKIDNAECYAVIQDQNQNNNKDLSDDKYLIVEKETPSKVGSLMEWRDRKWLIFSDEEKTIETHKQHKIKPTNHVIKWMVGDKICRDGKGYDAYVQNNTLYTLGVSMSGGNAWIVNAKMTMYLPNNEETRAIKIGERVFIGNNVYEVMMNDFVSRSGLIHYLLEENFYNPNIDDLENGVANRWKDKNEDGVATGDANNSDNNIVNEDNYTLSIEGGNTIKVGKTSIFKATMSNQNGDIIENPIMEWSIVDLESVSTVVEQDQSSITIRIANNFKFVGNQITIVGKATDGTLASKTVNVISPY